MLHENLGYAKWLPQPPPRAEDIKGRRWADGRVESGVVKVKSERWHARDTREQAACADLVPMRPMMSYIELQYGL